MKKMLFSFCLLMLSISIFATDVSGNQSGTWNLAGSPYNVVGEITVPINETLEIEAGVEVIAMGNYKITAYGNIIAVGTSNDTIRFYGDGGLNWGGLRLEDEANESQFNYCRISNTDDINNYPIQSINSPIFINHSFFDDHQSGISFFALSSNNPSYMEIKNSKIAYVQKSGITITDNSNALIDSCEITQCGLGTSFYGAIQLSLQNNSHSCNPIITNNYIHHNDKQGITMGNIYNYDEMAPTVENNLISENLSGIYLYNAKGYYSNNIICNNFVENDPNSGAGVMLYGSGADGTFYYNDIYGNYTGFFLQAGATANLGDLSNANADDDGFNMIHENIFYDGIYYSVVNNSSQDIMAENNVWDYEVPIEETIIDGNDDPAYGIVDYEPYLPVFPPPDSLTFNISQLTLFIYPPSTPTYAALYGYNIYRDGELIAESITSSFFLITSLPPGTYTFGASCVYEGDYESTITDTTIFIPHILNPPQNANATSSGYITWEEPEPGSTSPFLYYNIYLDECLIGTTIDLYYQLEGLVSGQQYMVGLSAEYEAGESNILEFELPYVNFDDNTIQMVNALYNYPNPFNPTTTISFSVTQNSDFVSLEIFNLKGQKVKTFPVTLSPESSLGKGSIIWDGTDQTGKPVSSGVYFYKLKAGKDFSQTKRMLLLK